MTKSKQKETIINIEPSVYSLKPGGAKTWKIKISLKNLPNTGAVTSCPKSLGRGA